MPSSRSERDDLSDDTARRLAAINRRFYDERAHEFHAKRDRGWPGFHRVLALARQRGALGGDAPRCIFDVACGNGRFAGFLAGALPEEELRRCRYEGLDASAPLLALARERAGAFGDAEFVLHDLTDEPLPERDGPPADLIVLLGALHHLPGQARRRRLLGRLAERLAPGGLLAFTAWQFAAVERFRRRIVPWETYNAQPRADGPIDPTHLSHSDHLLRWGDDDAAVRYCHFADEACVKEWLVDLPLETVARFGDDGFEDGVSLNQYTVLRRAD